VRELEALLANKARTLRPAALDADVGDARVNVEGDMRTTACTEEDPCVVGPVAGGGCTLALGVEADAEGSVGALASFSSL
jgi:hypothetical protein